MNFDDAAAERGVSWQPRAPCPTSAISVTWPRVTMSGRGRKTHLVLVAKLDAQTTQIATILSDFKPIFVFINQYCNFFLHIAADLC